jgi:Universal stress protein family
MTAIPQILCATDLTPTSEPACEEALLQGRLFYAHVVLLHVVPTTLVLPSGEDASPELDRQLAGAAHGCAHDWRGGSARGPRRRAGPSLA